MKTWCTTCGERISKKDTGSFRFALYRESPNNPVVVYRVDPFTEVCFGLNLTHFCNVECFKGYLLERMETG